MRTVQHAAQIKKKVVSGLSLSLSACLTLNKGCQLVLQHRCLSAVSFPLSISDPSLLVPALGERAGATCLAQGLQTACIAAR